MSARDQAKRQLENALRGWISRQSSQDDAARILGLYKAQVSRIVNRKSPHDVGWLLDAWEASGGQWELVLGRDENS